MVRCPICGNEVRVIAFGSAFIAVCCGRIIYRGSELPDNDICEVKGDRTYRSCSMDDGRDSDGSGIR